MVLPLTVIISSSSPELVISCPRAIKSLSDALLIALFKADQELTVVVAFTADTISPFSTFAAVAPGGSVKGNEADNGGGIYVYGTLEMNSGTIGVNKASNDGGGIYADDAILKLNNARIIRNTADDCSGGLDISLRDSASYINNSVIAYNSCDDKGGGIWMGADGKSLSMNNTEIEFNTSNNGAGIYLDADDGSIEIAGCTVRSNSAKYGGGVYVNNGKLKMSSGSEIRSNNASKEGGGIYCEGGLSAANSSIVA